MTGSTGFLDSRIRGNDGGSDCEALLEDQCAL